MEKTLFLVKCNGDYIGVMTMAGALEWAWDHDHAVLEFEPEPKMEAANGR